MTIGLSEGLGTVFAGTGESFITGDESGVVRVRDFDTQSPLGKPLVGHTSEVVWTEVSSDARQLATWSRDRTMRVWDFDSRQQLGRPLSAHSRGGRPNWSPHGPELAVPTLSGFDLWDFDTDTWPAIACEVAGRNLSPDEWAEFGPRTIEYRATCPEFDLT